MVLGCREDVFEMTILESGFQKPNKTKDSTSTMVK